MINSYLQAISFYLPEMCLSNEMLSEMHPEWSVEKISQKTGIYNRHVSAPDETAGDMALKVTQLLLNEYKIDKTDIDYVMLCTQSPDYFLPTTACIIQDRLGLKKNCGALDYNLGCSGFIYGLGLAKGLISSNQAKNILLITSETYTKYIHPLDKASKTIFGDGAAACLISVNAKDNLLNAEIMNFSYGTDGSGYENLIVKNGAMRNRIVGLAENVFDGDVFVRNDDYLFMDGKAIFDFTAFEVSKLLLENLQKNNLLMDNIDLFVFHQANRYMLNFIRNRCKIAEDKFYINLSDGGNTVSSTIPIALKKAIGSNLVKKNNKLLLCGFGVGLSMGAVILRF